MIERPGSETKPYQEGMRRELEEYLRIDTDYTERYVGLINDKETIVRKNHLGIVHLFDNADVLAETLA